MVIFYGFDCLFWLFYRDFWWYVFGGFGVGGGFFRIFDGEIGFVGFNRWILFDGGFGVKIRLGCY